MNLRRKLGILEKTVATFEQIIVGSENVSTLIEVDTLIDFALFKQAWHIMFDRQPLLRAKIIGADSDLFFDLSVNFDNIEIKHLHNVTFNDIETEYSNSDLITETKSLWRATLGTIKEENKSYIIFCASHSISDGTSIKWLLGDLLRSIIGLEAGKEPSRESYPIPEAFDNTIDCSRFSPPQQPAKLPKKFVKFENSSSIENLVSRNIMCTLEPKILQHLLQTCRQHKVTITAALSAAMTQAFLEQNSAMDNEMLLLIAINLRPYTKQAIADNLLAFYAAPLAIALKYNSNIGFWQRTKNILDSYNQAEAEFTLGGSYNKARSEDDLEGSDDLSGLEAQKNSVLNTIKNEQFPFSHTLSNLGVVDNAFADCGKYNVSNYFFTIKNHALFSMVVFATTIQSRLSLNFNYCTPITSDETAKAYAQRTVEILTDNLLTPNK